MRARASEYENVGGAWIHKQAHLADDVVVEPGALVGKDVEVGAGTWIGAGAVIYGPTRIGAGNQVYPTAVLGGAPQDLGYGGEPTRLEIGDRNVIREGVTMHRGSLKDERVTRIGNDNLLMGNTHIGHDVIVGDHVVTANGVMIGGHSHIHSHANFSGGTATAQFVTVGCYAFMGALSGTRHDLEPFLCHDVSQTSRQSRPQCVNEVGLKRAGFAAPVIKALRAAYKVLFLRRGEPLDLARAREELARREALCSEVEELLAFVERKRASRFGRHLNG